MYVHTYIIAYTYDTKYCGKFCFCLEIACLALLNGYHSYPAQEGRLVKGSLKIAFQVSKNREYRA